MYSTITRDRRLVLTGLVPLVVLAVLAGACAPQTVPTATAPPSPSPSASASESPSASTAEAPCVASDLTVTGGPWGGAAGSRGSDIVVENRGATTCLLPAAPAVAVVDQAGAVHLSTPPEAGAGPSVEPGGSVGFSVVLGNWCEQAISFPLHLTLALASGAIDIGELAVQSVDDLPPCNGPGQPATIEATAWQPG